MDDVDVAQLIEDATVINLLPDDVLVVEVDGHGSMEQTTRIKEHFKLFTPRPVLVVAGMHLRVLRHSE